MYKIKRKHILPLLKAKKEDGQMFSVTFLKKDGTVREMTARLGVKKHLAGGELKFDAEGRGYLPVFDMGQKDYRMINLNTLMTVKMDGTLYRVVD